MKVFGIDEQPWLEAKRVDREMNRAVTPAARALHVVAASHLVI